MCSGPQRQDDPTLPKEAVNSTRTCDNSNFTITLDQNVEIQSGHRGIVTQVTHLAMFYCLSHALPLRTMFSAQTSFSHTHGSTVWEDRGRYARLRISNGSLIEKSRLDCSFGASLSASPKKRRQIQELKKTRRPLGGRGRSIFCPKSLTIQLSHAFCIELPLVLCMTASTSPAAPTPRQNSAISPRRKTARKPGNQRLLEDKTETRKPENLKINSA